MAVSAPGEPEPGTAAPVHWRFCWGPEMVYCASRKTGVVALAMAASMAAWLY
jgi:hypothetical protein